MAAIKTKKQFWDGVDAAFETMKTRDEAKACYEFQRGEFKTAEADLCAYAAAHADEVFEDRDARSGWGSTDTVSYTVSRGTTVERADGGKLTDAAFLDALPKRYIRVKREINKAKIKADGLDAEALAQLGLVAVETASLKLAAKVAADGDR